MEKRLSCDTSDKKSYFLSTRADGWRLGAVVFVTTVVTATLLILSSGSSQAIETGAIRSNPVGNTPTDHSIASDISPEPSPVELDEANWREYTVKTASGLQGLAGKAGLNIGLTSWVSNTASTPSV